jgi:hypothetical protein
VEQQESEREHQQALVEERARRRSSVVPPAPPAAAAEDAAATAEIQRQLDEVTRRLREREQQPVDWDALFLGPHRKRAREVQLMPVAGEW